MCPNVPCLIILLCLMPATEQLIKYMVGKLTGTHYLCWGEVYARMWSFLITCVLYFRKINQFQMLELTNC